MLSHNNILSHKFCHFYRFKIYKGTKSTFLYCIYVIYEMYNVPDNVYEYLCIFGSIYVKLIHEYISCIKNVGKTNVMVISYSSNNLIVRLDFDDFHSFWDWDKNLFDHYRLFSSQHAAVIEHNVQYQNVKHQSTQITCTAKKQYFLKKYRKYSPIFSKWEYFCQNGRIINRQFWGKNGIFFRICNFCQTGKLFLPNLTQNTRFEITDLSRNCPIIFSSEEFV